MHKHFIKLLGLFLVSFSVTSCGDDEPNNPNETDSFGQNEEQPTNSTSVYEIVKRNVSVNCSYADYTFTFTISSTLQDELPTDVIQYGIGHASSSYKEEVNVSVGNQAYYYSTSTNGNTVTITLKNPFWFYYVFTEPDTDKWTMCETYYNSYLVLKKKGYNNLSSDEKDLYNGIVDELNNCQREAKTYYRPTIYVIVNNHYYKLKSYQIS